MARTTAARWNLGNRGTVRSGMENGDYENQVGFGQLDPDTLGVTTTMTIGAYRRVRVCRRVRTVPAAELDAAPSSGAT